MANYRILTNNPAVLSLYGAVAQGVTGGVADVFAAVRDAVHLGAALISHPLAGSVKPNENPYRSVMLSTRRGQVDADSLRIIEDAIVTLRKLPVRQRHFTERVLDDFAAIDLDLMRSAMQALPAAYYDHGNDN